MNKRAVIFIAGGAAAVALLLGGALIVGQQQTRSDAASARSALPHATATAVDPSIGAAGASTAEPTSPPEKAAPAPDVEPGASSQPPAAEVLPPEPDTSPALPPSTPLPVLVTTPLPATASATGKIVHGFPSHLIPTAPQSTVVSSSVASEGSHLQAALTAKSTMSADDVVAYYRTAFAKYGLLDSAAPAGQDSSALNFTRGTSSVTLTVTETRTGCRYIVFGALTAAD